MKRDPYDYSPAAQGRADHFNRRASARMTVSEIAHRLGIGRSAVYSMLEQGIIPNIRVGRQWLITRYAYEQWEQTCGLNSYLAPVAAPKVKV